MPRVCTLCRHKHRAEIDAAIVHMVSYRDIVKQFRVSLSAVHRHASNHLPATIARAREALSVTRGDTLLEQVRRLLGEAWMGLARAEAGNDLREMAVMMSQVRGTLELLARVFGEIQETTTVNVIVLPEWQRLRTRVVDALVPYPKARAAVIMALETPAANGDEPAGH